LKEQLLAAACPKFLTEYRIPILFRLMGSVHVEVCGP
jgi:hypothetical protein